MVELFSACSGECCMCANQGARCLAGHGDDFFVPLVTLPKRAVMLSIRPKFCEMISEAIKTVEVRVSRPMIEPPFKVYVYQTAAGKRKPGRVIGEFVCDAIEYLETKESYRLPEKGECCLTIEELTKYANDNNLYGWHISDFKLYETPKEVSDFRKYNRKDPPCAHVYHWKTCDSCAWCNLKRPPQSWCYVEQLKEDQ